MSTATRTDTQSPARRAADGHELILVQGTRMNNLEDIRDGKRATLFIAGVGRPLRGSLASSVLATARPLSSPEVKRLGFVRLTEVLRNG